MQAERKSNLDRKQTHALQKQ